MILPEHRDATASLATQPAPPIRSRVEDGICTITFNRPTSLNAFTFEMYEQLITLLEGLRYNLDVKVIIMTGTGKAFCVGHDVKTPSVAAWTTANAGKAQNFRAVMGKLGSIPPLMRSLPQPIIAAVNGVTSGIGYSIAIAADLCIAARSAKFVNGFHNVGTGHELGISYMLPRLIGHQRAAELLLTGRHLPAEEAAAIGMILRVVDDEQLLQNSSGLARDILINSPIGISLTKQSMWLNADIGSLDAAIEMENRAIFISQSTIDTAEKRQAFIEKRPPQFHQK